MELGKNRNGYKMIVSGGNGGNGGNGGGSYWQLYGDYEGIRGGVGGSYLGRVRKEEGYVSLNKI